MRGKRIGAVYYLKIAHWGSLALLLGYPIWVRTGRPHHLQPPILWIALFLLCAFLAEITLRSIGSPKATDSHLPRRQPIAAFFCDPALWIALAVVSLLGVQRFNAGRELVFDFQKIAWFFSDPAYPSLPSALSAEAANEAFYVTVPALIVALCLRHAVASRQTALRLMRVFVYNAGALALFGMVQFFSGTTSIYWLTPLEGHFYASFTYANHAGAFFLFSFCLSLGLIFRDVHIRGRAALRSPGSVFICITAILSFLSIHLSYCRAAILLGWVVIFLTLVWLYTVMLRDATLATRVNTAFLVIAIAVVLISALTVFAGDRLQREFAVLQNKEYIDKQLEARRWLIKPALAMVADDPLFGKGYRAFRHFYALYMPEDKWDLVTITGRANIHNDALEALVEFGAFGFTMLCLFGLLFLRGVFRSRILDDGPRVFAGLALTMMLVHGLVDLPFRTPALLMSFALVLACLKPLADHHENVRTHHP